MSIQSAIEKFEGITLTGMDGVKLMNRTDRKFWFNVNHLEQLLLDITDDYFALEIGGERALPYATTYYDTPSDHMYITHHRGKLNRFKIRRRCYVATESSFLEIKFKNNKGRTIKERIKSPYDAPSFSDREDRFIASGSPYAAETLSKSLENSFRRLMLVSRDMRERCTIDLGLTFCSNGVTCQLDQLVVVEVKSEGRARSKIIEALTRRRIRPSGFSKYCMGRSLTDNTLKHNAFNLKHRMIKRRIESL